MSKKISFEEAFAQATSEAIKILGDIVSKIVTDYLEARYSINPTNAANNPGALDEALEHAIDGGRTIVERRLMNILYEKLGIEPNTSRINTGYNEIVTFEQRVNEARQRYSK
ncbi:MAG: hypothetical protein E6L04_10285 [Thaumarchaeota archaeon]|nr:MAG: hypothetical protein E6L04_10285 [Nitrososphaerota archaeon]